MSTSTHVHAHPAGRIADDTSLAELTVRGIILGAIITVIFTASNVYLGLKVGLTFSSSIPAAVISMAVLRMFAGSNILENNMVQTQASAAGTLSSIIFILPGLVMIGYWQGFPYWQTLAVCAAGGMLGVMYTIPLRHAMVVQSDLPYPEGVAAAEILRVGTRHDDVHDATLGGTRSKTVGQTETGITEIVAGGVTAAVVTFATSGLRVLSEGVNVWFAAGTAVIRLSTGFSLALLGAGYLIGIVAGMAMLLGLVIAWGVAVPVLTSLHTMPADSTLAQYATGLWSHNVRFIGAGTIGVAAVWTLATLFKPMLDGLSTSFRALSRSKGKITIPRTELDLSPTWIAGITLVLIAVLVATFASFLGAAPITRSAIWGLVIYSVLFAVLFGFLVAAACGYMAGLIGSSASPISGIGIVAVILVSLLILLVASGNGLLESGAAGRQLGIALAIFTTSAVIAVATISNDNMQDLKTGWLVGATPWRQQVALLIGCVVGAMVIPPILDLLYHAYGFTGAMPRAGMDPSQALAAPQATLMTAIATGIFSSALNWNMLSIGVTLGVVLVVIDEILRRRAGSARLPVLAVGIGIYLPPTVAATLVLGTVLAWLIERTLKARARKRNVPYERFAEASNRRGVLLASGLIVGESLVGVLIAAVIGFSGKDAPLAVVGSEFGATAQWLGLIVFAAVAWTFARRVLSARAAL